MIEPIYEDEDLIAINKPHGLLVHRTKIAADVQNFALQMVRDYCGHYVYPIHRLDRKTSGVLLFGKSSIAASVIKEQFSERTIQKTYIALVRGFTPKEGEIDYPVGEQNKKKEAKTLFKTLKHYEIKYPSYYHSTSRYSFVELSPLTGRYHQIRMHLSHIRHPIIGDRPHGCNKQNRFWKNTFGMETMLLHSSDLFLLDLNKKPISIHAPMSDIFDSTLKKLESISIHLK